MSKEMKKSPSEASASSPTYSPPIESISIESECEIIKFSDAIEMNQSEKCKFLFIKSLVNWEWSLSLSFSLS